MAKLKNYPKASEAEVGVTLHGLRSERGLTLQAVSELCDVSISTLSKIENGQVLPTYGTMKKLADGFGVSLETLFSGSAQANSTAKHTTTRLEDALQYRSSRYIYDLHSKELLSKAMIPLVMKVFARDEPAPNDWSWHDGEEFIYVISGEVNLFLEHYAPFRLKKGESAYIDSRMRHAFSSVSKADATILSICYDPKHRDRDALQFIRDANINKVAATG
jgi:transcriptional regulator with XRE-family HTH domain